MYKPGDFTVTIIPDGFMIGRLLDRPGARGPWWEYIRADVDFDAAVRAAKQLAERHGARAWVYENHHSYREITPDAIDTGRTAGETHEG